MSPKRSKDGFWKNSILLIFIGILAVAEILLLQSRHSGHRKPCPTHAPCRKSKPSSAIAMVSADALGHSGKSPHNAAVATLDKTVAADEAELAKLPYYDIVGVIFATASEHDTLRMDAAAETWLSWSDPEWKFTYFIILCMDDPGVGAVDCKPGPGTCARYKKNVILLPCKHGYSTIATKSTEGFRYLANHYRFKYVLKADIDTMVDMRCLVKRLKTIDPRCSSFGMGSWRQARSSKVFLKTDPGAGKYPNEPYKKDTGLSFYAPYMVGTLNVWSSDVARFIGMAGLPSRFMPKWRHTWTIDDAAIGTFVIGLDICRVEMTCHVVTDVEFEQFAWRYNGDVTGHKLKIVPDHPVSGFEGPLRDDVPGTGDLENIHTETVEECAEKCRQNVECRSFEHSPTAGRRAAVKNCQIATGTQRTGKQCDDYSLYLKKLELLPTIVPDGPVDGFDGPLKDDVPGLGDLDNVYTKTLQECASKCLAIPDCKSFEHSPTPRISSGVKNCQLNTGTQKCGIPYEDYSLYMRQES